MSDKFPITHAGYTQLEKELKQLKSVERPAVIQAIATARELGDLSENAEYSAAREKQSFIEGRILDLESRVARADIIDVASLSGTQVKFGATVTLIDSETEEEVTYQVVGEYEADITKHLVSIVSPIARAMIGKKEGDFIEVTTPRGTREYEIVKVRFQ